MQTCAVAIDCLQGSTLTYVWNAAGGRIFAARAGANGATWPGAEAGAIGTQLPASEAAVQGNKPPD